MSTLENTYLAPSITEPELHLLLERDAVEDWRRWRVSGLGTIGAHAVVIGILLIWKAPTVVRPP